MISLSVLVPVYNEQDTIEKVLTRLSNLIIPEVKNEIIIWIRFFMYHKLTKWIKNVNNLKKENNKA